MSAKQQELIIVGAGPGGLFAAIHFAQKGFLVTVIEVRGDPRKESENFGRSVNLSLPTRGILALEKIGAWGATKKVSVKLRGRIIHTPEETLFQPYGTSESEVEYSIKRKDLIATLLTHADQTKGIKIFFNRTCTKVDLTEKKVHTLDTFSGETKVQNATFIVGADGIHSTVRKAIFDQNKHYTFKEEVLDWGYRELSISQEHSSLMRRDCLHVWPSKSAVIFVFPNINKTFSCTFILPLSGEGSFEHLRSKRTVDNFFQHTFPDLCRLIPNLTEHFLESREGRFICNYMAPWHYKGAAVLLGDACHAVMPFYSQGVSVAFGDALLLGRLLDAKPNDFEGAFRTYQTQRKQDTDILTQISRQRFFELKNAAATKSDSLRQLLELRLAKTFPRLYKPLYSFIVHTDTPYAEAVKQYERQKLMIHLIRYTSLIGSLSLPPYKTSRKGLKRSTG